MFELQYSANANMPEPNADNVILGLGNIALSDDAIGIKVVRYIVKNYPNLSDLHIIDAGNLSYQLTAVMEQAHNLVVLYAAKLGHSPGTITTVVGSKMDQFLKRAQRNANETALADMFEIAKLAHRLPTNRGLIIIEPKKTSWGNRLSSCVNKAIPQLAETALALMTQWTDAPFQQREPSDIETPTPVST
ncbi:MAG: hydrogenase maturation protease [Gammaproteobacteria bacterium]